MLSADVRTQAMYQLLDSGFIGLIFSCFSEEHIRFVIITSQKAILYKTMRNRVTLKQFWGFLGWKNPSYRFPVLGWQAESDVESSSSFSSK